MYIKEFLANVHTKEVLKIFPIHCYLWSLLALCHVFLPVFSLYSDGHFNAIIAPQHVSISQNSILQKSQPSGMIVDVGWIREHGVK